MKLDLRCYRLAAVIAFGTWTWVPPLASQQPAVAVSASGKLVSTSAMDAFAAAHVEVALLRGKVQAELAEPKSKKPEVQAALRDKLQLNTDRILKQHDLTEIEFARLTREVSTDFALRKQFDEAVAKLTGGRGG